MGADTGSGARGGPPSGGGGDGGASPEGARAADARGPLEVLLEVQDLDTAIAQLQHRRSALPERQALARLTADLAAVASRSAEVQAARAELAERQRALEEGISTATSRREALEQRMYTARGAPARDLQAMDDEIRHLRRRREEMEDAELEVMVALEPLDAELAALEAQEAELRAEGARTRAALASAEGAIDAELAVQVAARRDAAAALPDDLRQRYESLAARLGGTGAARLVGSRCSGCHLDLPSMEVERLRHLPPGTVATCEQCGRILVPVHPGG